MTLKQKLLVFVTLVILIVTTALTLSTHLQLRSNIEQEIIDRVILINTQATGRISDWLTNKKNTIASVAASQSSLEQLPNVLSVANEAGNFASTYVGFENGRAIFNSGPAAVSSNYDPRTRPWYHLAQKSNTLSVTEPYPNSGTSEFVLTIVVPTRHNETGLYSVYAGDVIMTDIVETVLNMDLGKGGTSMLLNTQGNIIAYSDTDMILKPFSAIVSGISASEFITLDRQNSLKQVSLYGIPKLAKVTHIENSDWYLLALVDEAEMFAPLHNLLINTLIIAFVTLIVLVIFATLGINKIIQPLTDVSKALYNIVRGEGDLTQRLTVKRKDEIGKISLNFNTFADHIQPIMQRVAQAANQLGSESEQSSGNVTVINREINQQQQEISLVASSLSEMVSTADSVAEHAENVAGMARESVNVCEQGMQRVQRNRNSIVTLADEIESSTQVINELNRNAQQISTILATIQGVAEQTNLLALNAAIEAARAGEQGRGFAVVADEVRVLSQRTHKSTEEIQAMIEQLQQTTSSAVKQMEKSRTLATDSVQDAESVSESLHEITTSITRITDQAVQIAAAAEQQKAVTTEVSRNTEVVKSSADALAKVAADSRQGAEHIAGVAKLLSNEMGRFKL